MRDIFESGRSHQSFDSMRQRRDVKWLYYENIKTIKPSVYNTDLLPVFRWLDTHPEMFTTMRNGDIIYKDDQALAWFKLRWG